jgi:hypothetical protein
VWQPRWTALRVQASRMWTGAGAAILHRSQDGPGHETLRQSDGLARTRRRREQLPAGQGRVFQRAQGGRHQRRPGGLSLAQVRDHQLRLPVPAYRSRHARRLGRMRHPALPRRVRDVRCPNAPDELQQPPAGVGGTERGRLREPVHPPPMWRRTARFG